METNEISYPLKSTVMVPYSGRGGWGFLTAGTLLVDKGMKSWGLLGQGDGNTNALSQNFRSMASTATCHGTKYMALTVYAKTFRTGFSVSPSITFGAYGYKSDWSTYFSPPTMPTQSTKLAVIGSLSITTSFIVSLGTVYYIIN